MPAMQPDQPHNVFTLCQAALVRALPPAGRTRRFTARLRHRHFQLHAQRQGPSK